MVAMRINLYQFAAHHSKVKRTIKAGRPVILTEDGVPVAIVEPLIPVSKAQEAVIQGMIESGGLQLVRKAGDLREWKYRRVGAKAA
jgi:antitoxin (DNA-binding transcriptional repressor) of toxin-antitoxin stability system